jgi:hypothetical protein
MEKSEFVSTPMLHKPKLDEDKQGKSIYATIYRSMIGSLMYLTSSKLDIHFDICMCARYQSRPTEKHITAVKTDLLVYKGEPCTWGLVHSKDSGFEVTAYLDADYAGSQIDSKSTSETA